MVRKTTDPAPSASRQAALRDRGRQIATVLRDPAAIAALDQLAAEHGSQRQAIEHALRLAAARR